MSDTQSVQQQGTVIAINSAAADHIVSPAATPETFRQKIIDALNDLLILHVTTVIGHVGTVHPDSGGAISTVGLEDPSPKVGNTVINMATGCTSVTFTPDFSADAALMTMHGNAVQTAREVRKETIDLLKAALDNFEALLNRKPAAP